MDNRGLAITEIDAEEAVRRGKEELATITLERFVRKICYGGCEHGGIQDIYDQD